MNCQEVMDYMQRQLDGDLDERETEILTNHIRHCSDCAAMFERLKLLSSGLESLPKVVPSYSLVDAILPRLVELQEQAQLSVPEPLIVLAGEGKLSSNRANPTGGLRRWRKVYAVGGAVAAGVIIGMLFLNNGSINSIRGNNDQSNLTADTTGSSDRVQKTAGSDMTSSATDSNVSQSDGGGSDTETAKHDSAYNTNGSDKKVASQSYDPNGEPMSSNTSGGQQQLNVVPSEQSPNYSISGNNAAGNQKPANSAAPVKSGGESNGTGASINSTTQVFRTVMASPISPDQKYQAFIVENTVCVYTVSDSVKVFQSAKRTGIADLKWSEDSSQLTYVVNLADGTKKTYVVDPQSETEQEQSSK